MAGNVCMEVCGWVYTLCMLPTSLQVRGSTMAITWQSVSQQVHAINMHFHAATYNTLAGTVYATVWTAWSIKVCAYPSLREKLGYFCRNGEGDIMCGSVWWLFCGEAAQCC